MATAVRRVVVFLLVARAVVGLPMVVFLAIGFFGLAGFANPSASHTNRILLGLCFEAAACIAGVPLALYVHGRPTNTPSLNALVLMALGPSLIPFWCLFPFARTNPLMGWSVVIGMMVCGVVAMVWPRSMPARTPMLARGRRERTEVIENPAKQD